RTRSPMREDIVQQGQGNNAVQDFMRHWLKESEKGEINYVAAAFARTPTDIMTGHGGVIGNEFAICYALDELKIAMREMIEERRPPVIDVNAPANKWLYHLLNAACSYDFLAWLYYVELVRRKEKCADPLVVCFYGGNKASTLDRALMNEARAMHFHNVM